MNKYHSDSFFKFINTIAMANKNQTVEGGYLIPETWEVCKNWWEEFKMRWFPPLLKRIWPVKYKKVKIREKFLKFVEEQSIVRR